RGWSYAGVHPEVKEKRRGLAQKGHVGGPVQTAISVLSHSPKVTQDRERPHQRCISYPIPSGAKYFFDAVHYRPFGISGALNHLSAVQFEQRSLVQCFPSGRKLGVARSHRVPRLGRIKGISGLVIRTTAYMSLGQPLRPPTCLARNSFCAFSLQLLLRKPH